MDVQRIAAFSAGDSGGNPAGVVLGDTALSTKEMARIAADVGYSETAFAVRTSEGNNDWRVRYFSPESEVPFCGHATIALGAALGKAFGPAVYDLVLNEARISVEAQLAGREMAVTLVSPSTRSRPAKEDELSRALALFGYAPGDLDDRIAPAHMHGGADHFLLVLKDRAQLSAMHYDLDEGRKLMRAQGWVTIMLAYIDGDQRFSVRNAFASGGVLEDPATGAAAAAFAGYLRDISWPHGGALTITQGEDMGSPSRIDVALTNTPGAPVKVSGTTRDIT